MGFFSFFCKDQDKEIEALKAKVKALQIAIRVDAPKVPPVNYTTPVRITAEEVKKLVQGTNMRNLDAYVYGIDKEDVEKILLANTAIQDAKYIDTEYDCDNFAQALLGLFNHRNLGRFAFGLAISATHAYNFFIDRNKQVWIVEPQSGKIYSQENAIKSKTYLTRDYLL